MGKLKPKNKLKNNEEPQPTAVVPYRIDIDRGITRLILGFFTAAGLFAAINIDIIIPKAPDASIAFLQGSAVLSLAVTLFLGFFLSYDSPSLINSKSRILSFAGICMATVAGARIVGLSEVSSHLVPLGAVIFIFALCHGMRAGVAIAAGMSLLCGMALRTPEYPIINPIALVLLGGSIVWSFAAIRIRKRLWLFNMGFIAGVIQLGLQLGLESLLPNFPNQRTHALVGGVITGAFLTALLPIIEYLFNVNTEISLLELSDLNQPLLRQLGLEAPGTYHHSLIVGTLAESAAHAIGANSLLSRVGAYFHDIGKLQKPEYFVENEGSQGSRHDKLSASMSSLIIGAHVKDGAEAADEYNLPRAVIEIIKQHHGTSLMEFFYEKSKADPNEKTVEEAFRYPGPKPDTAEAALIMLADAVEAASRTLDDPSPSRLKSLVHEITMKRLLDGQFDDSPMTIGQLAKAEECFVRVLAAIFHNRVAYPSNAAEPEPVEAEKSKE